MAAVKPKRVKQPEETRRKVMASGIRELRKHGYQGASLNRIVDGSGVTKGAFFHHFQSKREIALTMLEEVEGKRVRKTWIDPIGDRPDGISSILAMLDACRLSAAKHPSELAQGSTLWNIATEMSPLDDGFCTTAQKIYGEWVAAWETALRRDHAEGRLADGQDWHAFASWLVEAVESARAAARIHGSPDRLAYAFDQIAARLSALQTQGGSGTSDRLRSTASDRPAEVPPPASEDTPAAPPAASPAFGDAPIRISEKEPAQLEGQPTSQPSSGPVAPPAASEDIPPPATPAPDSPLAVAPKPASVPEPAPPRRKKDRIDTNQLELL